MGVWIKRTCVLHFHFCPRVKSRLTVFPHYRYKLVTTKGSRSKWPCSLERGCVAAQLFRIADSNSARGMSVCCVLSGRGFCMGLTTRPEEFYREWCVQRVWPQSPVRGGHKPELGRNPTGKENQEWKLKCTYRIP